MMRLKILLVGALLAGALIGPSAAETAPSTRIDVMVDGRILLDGKPAGADQLETRFATLEHGERRFLIRPENAPAPYTPAQKKAIDVVIGGAIRHKLNLVVTAKPAPESEKAQ